MTATSVQTKQRPWWLTLIMGIPAFVVGAILLWAPAKTKVDTYQLLIHPGHLLADQWVHRNFLDVLRPHGLELELFMGIVSIIAGSYILAFRRSRVALPRSWC